MAWNARFLMEQFCGATAESFVLITNDKYSLFSWSKISAVDWI